MGSVKVRRRVAAANRTLAEATAAVTAERVEREAERRALVAADTARREALPSVPVEDIRNARAVRLRDGTGWQIVIRVNRDTVTVRKWGIDTRVRFEQIVEAAA